MFASQVTVLDHNFAYEKYHLLTSMFGTNPALEKILKKTRRKKNNTKEGKETKNKENTRQTQQTVPGRGVLIENGDKE